MNTSFWPNYIFQNLQRKQNAAFENVSYKYTPSENHESYKYVYRNKIKLIEQAILFQQRGKKYLTISYFLIPSSISHLPNPKIFFLLKTTFLCVNYLKEEILEYY